MIDGLLIEVGTAVAHQVFEVKVRERLKSGTIQDFLTKRGHSILDSRKAQRQFDQVAEAVADRISHQVEVESGGIVPTNEVDAALLAVKDSFSLAEIDYASLLEIDLDPSALEGSILASTEDVLRSASLSEPARLLFDQVLRECCNYVTEIAMEVPELSGRAFREVLQRETELLDAVQEVLDRMPSGEGSDSENPDDVFELQYRRQIARKLDELTLFGLTVSEGIRRYPLTVAYISLRLDTGSRSLLSLGGTGANEDDDGTEDPEFVVGANPRLIIRGEAGSGKTTLLQWLAVTAARETFVGDALREAKPIPFFLQLRRYVGKKLPAPRAFLDLVTPALADQAPESWVSRQLASGRGLILVDGLDELPADQREDVAEWLEDLENTYPDCRFIVTSRSSGLTDKWIKNVGFADAELLPMSVADIDSFIEHWHTAAASGLSDEESKAELAGFEAKLKALVSSTPPIQSLATSPLMCAMLCALHRDRRTQVPSDRLELYRIALETLLDRRDIERRVSDPNFGLSLPQKLILLQDVAFWLLVNDQSDAPREDVIGRIRMRLKSMRRIHATAERVYEYLLERSGLLREPVVGRVDFLHRSFQEYLGAQEAVAQNHIGLLGDKAADDQWREVIILACGHASPQQARLLIEDLLERGNRNPSVKHVMHLMAVACLETAIELDADLVASIGRALRGLVPPSSMSEAKLLASAGELAVPALKGFKRRNVGKVGACVRALCLIGGDTALHALEEYAADDRAGVFKELVRGWGNFDMNRYAEIVLRRSALLGRGFETTDVSLVKAAEHLPGRVPIRCKVSRIGPDLEPLRGAYQVAMLDLYRNQRIRDISAISSLGGLESVDLDWCGNVEDFTALRDCPALLRLDVSHTSFGPNFECLPHHGRLEYLRAQYVPSVVSLSGIEHHTRMDTLLLSGLGDLPRDEWRYLTTLGSLRHVNVSSTSFPGLADLSESTQLQTLAIRAPIRVGSEVGTFGALRELELTGGADFSGGFAESISRMRRLWSLSLGGTALPRDLGWLPGTLKSFAISKYMGTTLDGLPTRLAALRVTAATNLRDIASLSKLHQLRNLTLMQCASLEDLSPLLDLPKHCHIYLEAGVRDRLPKELATNPYLHLLRSLSRRHAATPTT